MKIVIELRDDEDNTINPCTIAPEMHPRSIWIAEELLGDVKEFTLTDEKFPDWALQCSRVDVLAIAIAGHMIRTGKNRWEAEPI